jgi:hypothetical protein
MWPVINSILSLVEITSFTQESKSCKGFFLNKFSTSESTWIYNRSHGLQPGLYQPPRSLAFELDIYPHLLDPQSVFRWSKIFITLPQRSGLESLGHSVTVGKTILSKGKVSTTDFMGFSIQPVSLNFIYSGY